MQIDINELIELVKSVKPMFLNHTEAEHVTVKGRADFVTQVDIRVQEYEDVNLSVCIIPDLLCCRCLMDGWICSILKLLWNKCISI